MFEQTKIIYKCNKILRKYKIKVDQNYAFNIYKKDNLIHFTYLDTRETKEMNGFPVKTIEEAVNIIVEDSIWSYYYNKEYCIRQSLIYNWIYKEVKYDFRVYVFENILKILKDYDEKIYQEKLIHYSKLLNNKEMSNTIWIYNEQQYIFELKEY